MTFRIAAIALAVGMLSPIVAQAQAQEPLSIVSPDPAKVALARTVLDNGFPPETRMESMVGVADMLIDQIIASNPSLASDAKLRPVMERFSDRVIETTRTVLAEHMDSLMEGMAIAYADKFTDAELEALAAFVATEEGNGVLTKITEVNTHPAYAEANQRYMNEYMTYMPQLQAELLQDLVAASGKP